MPTLSLRFLADSSPRASRRSGLLEAILIVVGALGVALFILIPTAAVAVVAACSALWCLVLVSRAFSGKPEGLVLWWAAFFPLGYFALFPREHSIVTMERIVIFAAFVGLLFGRSHKLTIVPKDLRRTGYACFILFFVAGMGLLHLPEFLNSARTLFDSFAVPALLAWIVITLFDVRGRLTGIHTAVCVSSVISAAIAAGEMIFVQDFLPVGNSEMFYAGGIPRPNGPFASNDALALIGGFSLFFLLYLRTALGPGITFRRRILHYIGVAAALGMALMPMFRSVALTLLLVLVIDTFWEKRTTGRIWRFSLICVSVGLLFLLPLLVPRSVMEDRGSAENLYGRVAQLKQSFRVFGEHPWFGVGFSNFHEYVTGEPRYVASYEGIISLDWPHDNLLEMLTETGIIGFVPYVLIHVFLFRAMWNLRRLSESGRLAWRFFVYLFLTYWITGLTESSGIGFANIWYAFVIIVSYKYVLTSPDLHRPPEASAAEEPVAHDRLALDRGFQPVFQESNKNHF